MVEQYRLARLKSVDTFNEVSIRAGNLKSRIGEIVCVMYIDRYQMRLVDYDFTWGGPHNYEVLHD